MKRKWNFAIKLVWGTTFCSCFPSCPSSCALCCCSYILATAWGAQFMEQPSAAFVLELLLLVLSVCVFLFSLAFLLTFCAHFIYMHFARDARQLIPHSLCRTLCILLCVLLPPLSLSLSLYLPLSQVTEGSIAEQAGLCVEDVIVRINDTAATPLTHDEAHRLILSSGSVFYFGVHR